MQVCKQEAQITHLISLTEKQHIFYKKITDKVITGKKCVGAFLTSYALKWLM